MLGETDLLKVSHKYLEISCFSILKLLVFMKALLHIEQSEIN